jgi:hypothetical protein
MSTHTTDAVPSAAYRDLIARLEQQRDQILAGGPHPVNEVQCVRSGIASGLHTAIVLTIRAVEGTPAAIEYARTHTDNPLL